VTSTTYASQATGIAPAPTWGVVPGVVSVAFTAPPVTALPPTASADANALRIVLHIPAAQLSAAVAAHAPIVAVHHTDGTTTPFVVAGTFDASAATVAIDLPMSLLLNATQVDAFVATDAPATTPAASPYGPRYWNGTSWSQTGTIDPTKRTLVFIHGIFSSVETAFPCAATILAAGGYQQGVGFDYDWTQPPATEGPLFQTYLQQLQTAKLTSFDIEAHSYGTLITLDALPAVASAVPHVVLLGGPLPLEGTPIASSYLMTPILGILAAAYLENPSAIYDAFESGMVASLEPSSPSMQQILAGLDHMSASPRIIEVAGTKEYDAEGYLPVSLYVTLPWDGVVEQIAANETDIPNATAAAYPFVHTDLPCASPQIIQYVGGKVQP
jgi:pimeloyl-ACP methyl ester carboxylesterase